MGVSGCYKPKSMNEISSILNYFVSNMDVTSWAILGILFLIALILYVNRGLPFVRELVENIVVEAEKSFNRGEGQLKLLFAVDAIRNRLPFIFRILITKSMIVTLIEGTLNRISHTFEIDKDVDIKGNDSLLKGTKIDIKDDTLEVSLNTKVDSKDITNGDVEVYGGVKVSTDWNDKPNTTIEVGLKKKF